MLETEGAGALETSSFSVPTPFVSSASAPSVSSVTVPPVPSVPVTTSTAHSFRMGQLVSWCFEPSQPQRIASGLNSNFTLSPS